MPEVLGFGFYRCVCFFFICFALFLNSPKYLSASGEKQMSESQPISFLQLTINIFVLGLMKEKVANGQSEVL